jgi:hypothetical protein
MRRTLFAAFALIAASPAYAEGVAISMDEVRTLTFPKPVATVYVGNSSIAEVNMIDSRHAFVLGKIPGITNIVALDHQGDQVSNTHVSVMAREASTVTLQQGADRLTYSCTASHCDQTPEPGDNRPDFERVSGEIGTHEGTAKGAATGQAAQ